MYVELTEHVEKKYLKKKKNLTNPRAVFHSQPRLLVLFPGDFRSSPQHAAYILKGWPEARGALLSGL